MNALLREVPVAFIATWVVWLPITFWFGRLYCRWVCPLGLCQSLVQLLTHPRTRVRRVCANLPRSQTQRVVNWLFVALYFFAPLGYLLNPWGIFGRAVFVFFVPGLALFAAILVLALFGQGRLWCNWVCPLGTLFDLAARCGWKRERIVGSCRNCQRCFKSAGAAQCARGTTRRETLKGVALLAVVDKLTDGGLAPVVAPVAPRRQHPVLPPGARDDFAERCIACGACMAACPDQVLVPSTNWRRLAQPEMDFTRGRCLLGCVRCADICPAAAFNPLQLETRAHVHMGLALWNRERCVRTEGERCTACVRKCPVQAIHLVKGIPVVDAAVCIGCGACEHVCPARPEPAIYVEGYERQLRVTPMAEADLLAEMERLIVGGKTLVIARNGVIVRIETERGIQPLVAAYDQGLLKGSIVYDRAVGRAAAAFYAAAGAAKVHTLLAGGGAAAACQAAGVKFSAERTVERILNRERAADCPMERAADGLNENQKIIEKVRATLERMSAK